MTRRWINGLLIALLYANGTMLVTTACGSGTSTGSSVQSPGTAGSIAEFDSELTAGERQLVESAISAIESLKTDGRDTKWFADIFGGNGSVDVKTYIDQRVNYILSAKTNPFERIRLNGKSLDDIPNLATSNKVVARNIGPALWLEGEAKKPDVLQFSFNGRLLDIPSTRAGLMQIGPGFSKLTETDLINQVAVLVHEARHSDCTGGLHASDLERIKKDKPTQNNLCSHSHVKCPPGHDYVGLYACDDHAWGAYAVNAIYLQAMVKNCTSCSEAQKTVANQLLLDSFSRILIDNKAMLNGELGPPDMSSTDQVIDDA